MPLQSSERVSGSSMMAWYSGVGRNEETEQLENVTKWIIQNSYQNSISSLSTKQKIKGA
jgi:hypothetical protein